MVERKIFEEYEKLFIEENHKVNLISKNDEKYLWEKHICDSLGIEKFFEKYFIPKNILDIGTGGGFPSVPIAIVYPQIEVIALDSIGKKIRAVENLKNRLNLKNLTAICSRVENFEGKFDVITSRAVSSLKNICAYALPKLKKNGYFIAFKSRKAQEEIDEAFTILKKFKAEIIDILEYELPMNEKLERYLIVVKCCNK
ncbi:16S rRNA (guanine(527)-N(7))-methyltransferase RsmG [bacterium]|nr:16S rRNA (guanine(527)-N(7))-methyltransferase RsmG [bacterium]